MSQWNGHHGRGYGRKVRELKREEAAERAADFEARIQRLMEEQNITRRQAYPIAAREGWRRKRMGEILAERDRRIEDYNAGYSAYVLGEADPLNPSLSYRNGWERALSDERGETVPE